MTEKYTHFKGNELVSYNSQYNNSEYLTIGNVNFTDYSLYPWYEREVCYWYPSYTIYEKNKTEQAFKIIGKLIEKKVINDINVKKFIELVTEIASIL